MIFGFKTNLDRKRKYMCMCFPSPLKNFFLQIYTFYNFRFYGPTIVSLTKMTCTQQDSMEDYFASSTNITVLVKST